MPVWSDGPLAVNGMESETPDEGPRAMSISAKVVVLTAALAAVWALEVQAEKKTVCTITVNSADEKEMFRRSLPGDKFQFVELVERGRPDWLSSACRQGIRCDVLVISGHYDGGNEFFSEHLDTSEFLPVEEMERVSCSASCPGLFSQLKEVYLFGCNTLNPEAIGNAPAEIGRTLIRAGHSRAEADRLARSLSARHDESSRDRMRQIFMNVPVLYGFSSVAPLGPTAASILHRHFQSGGAAEVGSGRASTKLLGHFRSNSMVVTAGLSESDPRTVHRRDVCQFADDRLSPAQKLAFVHQLMGREMAEARMFLERIEKYAASLTESEREAPAVARALEEIASDRTGRDRYLRFARDVDQPSVRARMMELAGNLGWLTPAEKRTELMRMIAEQLASDAVGSAEVDLVCTLNKDGELDEDLHLVQQSAPPARLSHAAVLACLGSTDDHARVVQALTSPNDKDVQIAQVYLRHRPIADVNELRAVTAGVTRMNGSDAQVRALDTLARQQLSDPESLEELARFFPVAGSASVQTAIAGILIRSDYPSSARSELAQTLRQHRLKSQGGQDLIDVLIRRFGGP
jgi:hypothetical protein